MLCFIKPFKWLWKHKFISFIILAAIIAGGYFYYKQHNSAKDATEYLTATVEKGMLISSISGTGQVSSSNQIDVKPKISGDIVTVAVIGGQDVKKMI